MARGYPDFEGNKVGLYLMPEWAAKEGKEWSKIVVGANKAFGTSANGSYLVPAGKTLYITQASWQSVASAAADW